MKSTWYSHTLTCILFRHVRTNMNSRFCCANAPCTVQIWYELLKHSFFIFFPNMPWHICTYVRTCNVMCKFSRTCLYVVIRSIYLYELQRKIRIFIIFFTIWASNTMFKHAMYIRWTLFEHVHFCMYRFFLCVAKFIQI